MTAKVLVVMGSDSDFPTMRGAVKVLREFGVSSEVRVCSAHRNPDAARELASSAEARGLSVIIAGAGMAAHLAGAMAAHSSLPVLGVPIDAGALRGVDALYSTSQMPPGVPVATLGIGPSGAKNAGILAVQILAVSDPALRKALGDFKRRQAEHVTEKDERLRAEFEERLREE